MTHAKSKDSIHFRDSLLKEIHVREGVSDNINLRPKYLLNNLICLSDKQNDAAFIFTGSAIFLFPNIWIL